jgi:hypothetical protein
MGTAYAQKDGDGVAFANTKVVEAAGRPPGVFHQSVHGDLTITANEYAVGHVSPLAYAVRR